MPSGEAQALYDERMMFSEKRHVLAHVQRVVEAAHGEPQYWVRAGGVRKG